MKWCLMWVLILASAAMAQEQRVRYNFTQGASFEYERVMDQNDGQNGGTFDNSFVHRMLMRVEVERVDSAGNGTLLCTILRQGYDPVDSADKGGQIRELSAGSGTVDRRDGDGMPVRSRAQYTAMYADDTPKFRVTLSPRGRLIEGEILEKSEQQKSFETQSTPPGTVYSRRWSVSDVTRLDLTIHKFYPPLPDAMNGIDGIAWRDSAYDELEGTVAGSGMPGRLPGQTKTRNEYVLTHGVYQDTIPCRSLVILSEKKAGGASTGDDVTLLTSWSSQTELLFRKTDGVYLGSTINSVVERLLHKPGDDSATSQGTAHHAVMVKLLKEAAHR